MRLLKELPKRFIEAGRNLVFEFDIFNRLPLMKSILSVVLTCESLRDRW
jgi:hypothetical protein